jgi:hypothetical protein
MPIPTPTLDSNGRYPFQNEFRPKSEELEGTRFGMLSQNLGGSVSWVTALEI